MPTINITTIEVETFLLFLGGAIELLTNLVGILLSLTNLCLVSRTSVIHPNMKSILIFQSFFILTRANCRFVICLFKFILWDPISAEKITFFPGITIIYYISIYSRNFVPHILIIERILATLYVRSYEKCRGYLFTMIWSPIALTVSIYIAFTTSPQIARPLTNVITTAAELVIGSMELIIFYMLCRYNSQIYQKMFQNERSDHSLSLRYQLSENIRIGKQLIPPLSLNLLTIITSLTIITWSYLNLPKYYQMFTLITTVNSITALLIELLIITCHPFLKRDLIKIWHQFGTLFGHCHLFPVHHRISHETVTVDNNNNNNNNRTVSPVGIAQRDLISGKALVDQSKPEDHFAMLRQAWEMSRIN